MKYTSEQLKDLIYFSQNGCLKRSCQECRWITVNRHCYLLVYGLEQNYIFQESEKDPISIEVVLRKVAKVAKFIIQNVIGGEDKLIF